MSKIMKIYVLLLLSFCCKSTSLCKYSSYESLQNILTEENKPMISKSFFDNVAVDDIGIIDTTNVEYRKFNLGIYGYSKTPILGYKSKENKKSKYNIILQNNISRKKNNGANDETAIDSIGISFIMIRKRIDSGGTEIIYWQRKGKLAEFKESDFDYSILTDIRKNFLLRMKYTKYHLEKDAIGLPILTETYPIY